MTRQELFEKYKIEERHDKWDNSVDNWMSVELFRVMHGGRLPQEDDRSTLYVLEFRDKLQADQDFAKEVYSRKDFGSLYLTCKRMIYRFADMILEELNTSSHTTQ